MTPGDAVELGNLIKAAWPTGTKLDAWCDELEECHYGQAKTTILQLRRIEEHLTIPRFFAHYRSLTVADDKVECDHCGGGGWTDAPDHQRHTRQCRLLRARDAEHADPLVETAPVEDCNCHAMIPCGCPAGRRVEATYKRIIGGNAA